MTRKGFTRREKDIWSNFEPEKDKAYVIYCGNRYFGELTEALIPRLSNIHGRPVEVIKLTNVVGPFDENIIAAYPGLDEMMQEPTRAKWFWPPHNGELKGIFQRDYVQGLMKRLIENQGMVFFDAFANTLPTEELPEGVKVMGPPSDLVRVLDNKFDMYAFLEKNGFPVPEGLIVEGRAAVIKVFKDMFSEGAYVTRAHSVSGRGCQVFGSESELEKSCFLSEDEKYSIRKKIDVVSSPTISGIIGGPDDVHVFYLVDQILAEGTKIKGVEFPSRLPQDTQEEIFRITEDIGHTLAETEGEQGFYRGFFNVDVMVAGDGRVYVAEINPKKFGSCLVYHAAYETLRPERSPSLAEMYFLSSEEERSGIHRFDRTPGNLHWARRVVKVPDGTVVKSDLEGYTEDLVECFRERIPAFTYFSGRGNKTYGDACVLGEVCIASDKPFDGEQETSRHEELIKEQVL